MDISEMQSCVLELYYDNVIDKLTLQTLYLVRRDWWSW